jgi:hypothetical protein
MNQSAIVGPFMTMMLLTLIVWFYMYVKRIPLIQRSKIDPNALTAAELTRISPPSVSNPSDNLKNLFELPTLFYGLVLYLFQHCHASILALLHFCIGAVVHGDSRSSECALVLSALRLTHGRK